MKKHRLTAVILVALFLFQTFPVMGASDIKTNVADEPPQLPEITQAQFKAEMTKVIANGHPYMIATKDKIAKIKEYAFGRDEFLTEQYSLVKAEADKLLNTALFKMDEQIANNSANNTNAMLSYTHTMTLALVYLVEGDSRYAQRAYDQMQYLCNLDSWGRAQLIDNVQFAWAVGFCYDWLYDWLNAEQREFLVSNLRRLHLDMASDVFKNPQKAEYKDSFYQAFFVESNHGLMDTSCTFLAAMAIADTDMDFATELMALSQKQFNTPVSNLYPDGQWYEGYSYWGYVGPYVARFMQSMKGAFGHCFGYDEVDFLKKLADFPIYMTSNFAAVTTDNSHFQLTPTPNPIYYTIGTLANDHNLQTLSVNQIKEFKNPDAIFLLMYDPLKNYDGEVKLNLDKHFRNIDDVTLRSSFDGTQNTFAALHVRADIVDNSTQNGMAHRGSISAFDALGERWISDMGRETYYEGYWGEDHFKWYRTRTESASCILIEPSQDPGQVLNTPDLDIDVLESGAGSAYSIADLTEAYSTWASSYSRGIQLTDNRKVLVVQDEIVLKKPSEMYSLFNIYKADIELLSDGKSAILHKNNKKVYVTIDCDEEFTLGSMPAEPLSTSPLPDLAKPNSPNTDFTKLFIHFDSVESANIRVCFIPYICEEELSTVTCREFVPMSEWIVREEIKDIPMLEDIKVNGVSLEGFEPYNRCYYAEDDFSAHQINAIYDNSKYNVTVRSDEATGSVNIMVTDKADISNINSYSVLVPVVTQPETTYTNSSFTGIMMPQEFYRISNNNSLSAMYFKDTMPDGYTKAVLTVYAGVIGETFDTTLKLCILDADTELRHLAGSNTSISKNSVAVVSQSAIDMPVISGRNIKKMEYDITAMLPENGGDFVFAVLPEVIDEDYIVLPSHYNSDYSLRPRIKYYQ